MMTRYDRRRLPLHGIVGFGLLILAEIMMFRRVEPFFSWFYCFAWWAYILICDSLISFSS
jgi:hypothetical protein